MSGIYITRGMTLSIQNITLRIGDDGAIVGDPISLQVRFDTCPTWMQIAKRHKESAVVAREIRQAAWAASDEIAKSAALEAEFEASMQAIMAAAIAWDAVYAVLREHVVIPNSMSAKWREGRTARYIQVAEIVRRAFPMKPKAAASLRSNLKELYRYRDLAVHPSGKIEAPMLHPELDLGMEWRFVYFRATNAELAVQAAAAMLWDLAHYGRTDDAKLKDYQKTLAARLEEIFPDGAPKIPESAISRRLAGG